MKTEFSEEEWVRWFKDVRPVISKLAQLANDCEDKFLDAYAQDRIRTNDASTLFKRVSDELADELEDIKNALIDAKARARFGMDAAELADKLRKDSEEKE